MIRTLPDKLYKGAHTPDGQMCIMEAVAYLADETWSDHPACTSPEIAAYVRGLNDQMPDDQRQRLLPFIPRLLNTADIHPRFEFADAAVREFAPLALDATHQPNLAARLRSLAPIIDTLTAAYAAAAYAAAADAAAVAAYAAAVAAAYAAADAAADAAAADAAAYAAADAAADAAIPVWDAALALLDRILTTNGH